MVPQSCDELVTNLGVPHRAKAAKLALIETGPAARSAVHAGLANSDPAVVLGCIDVIDHILDAQDLLPLLAATSHGSGRVRQRSLHALICENCKAGVCRPSEADVRAALLRGSTMST